MSVTDAFRLLNQSIRESSRIEQDHERRMADIADRRMKMEYEMNDPRNLLARQQAAEQLKATPVNLGETWTSEGKSPQEISYYKVQVRPKMEEYAETIGAEINEKGELVFQGTDTPYTAAKWQADEIMAQFNTVYTQMNTRSKQIDYELDSLNSKIELEIANQKSRGGSKGKSDQYRLNIARWEQKRDKLIEERDNPQLGSKRLLSENMELMQQYKTMAGHRNPNQKWMGNIMKQVEANNAMLKMMSTSNKNIKPYVYSAQDRDGTIHKFTMYGGASQPMPDKTLGPRPGLTYYRGEIKAPTGKSGEKTMTDPQKDTAYKDYKKWETEKAAIKEQMGDEQAIIDQLGWKDSMDTEKRSIVKLIMDGKLPEAKQILEDKMVRYREKYGSGPKKVKGIPSQKEYIDRKLKGNSLGLERD